MKTNFFRVFLRILICCVVGSTISSQDQINATVGDFVRKKIDDIDEATSRATVKDLITISKPPTSLICNKTNSDTIKFVNNAEGKLYLLSVNELLSIEIDENDDPSLQFLATLLRFEEMPLEVQIENWQNMTFVILKLQSAFHIYVMKNDQRAVSLEPIQKISTHSSNDRFIMFKNKNDLCLVTYWIKNDALDANELTFYKWKASFFSKESQELVDLPNKSELFIFNQKQNEPLILSIGYGNTTRVVILKLNLQTNRWTKLQSLHFKQDFVKHYVIDGNLYLIGCSSDSFCAIYEWTQTLFRRHVKVNNQIFDQIKKIYYRHDIIIAEDYQRNLSFHTTANIVNTAPALMISNYPNVASYAVYKSPIRKKLFYVDFLLEKSSLAINFYSMSINKAQTAEPRESKHGDGAECVTNLKAILKRRLPTVQSAQVLTQKVTTQDNTLQMEHKRFIHANFSNVKDSKIRRLKMPHSVKLTGTQLQKKSIEINIRVEQTRKLLKRSQQSQVEGRADEGLPEVMENIEVEDLIYKGGKPIFEGLLLKSSPVLIFNDNMKLRNLTVNKLVVQSNRINQIELTELLNTTEVKRVKGLKRIQSLKVKELVTLKALNDLPQEFLEIPSADRLFEETDDHEFEGDVNVRMLNVKALNGLNVSALVENVFLQNERTELRGSLILGNLTNVNELVAKQLLDIPVDNLMTTSTNQTVRTDVRINKFSPVKLNTETINNEKLSQNVATIDNLNFIEVPTQFMTLHVLKSLNIRDEEGDESEQRKRVAKTIETLKQHVIGKDASDLEQIYNGKVVIQGSLVVKNLETGSPKTKIILSGKEVPQNISANYWMKNLKQDIQAETFTIVNQQMKSANVLTNLINGYPVKKYMRLDENNFVGKTLLGFKSVIVEGDVKGHKDNIPSMLFYLNQTVVPRQGPPFVIDSSIGFRGSLLIRNLATNFINDELTKNFVHSDQEQVVIFSPKNVNHLELDHLHVDGSIKFENYNNVNIKQFMNDAVRIDRPIELDSLKVERFDATNLITEFFEGHQFKEFIESLDKQFQLDVDGSARTKRNVRITGNVDFQADLSVDTLHGNTRFDDFVSMFVMKNDVVTDIGGKKTFQQNVILGNLETKAINEFPVERLLYQSLARGEKQTISGEFFVKNLNTKHIRARTLNNISWNQFIDKRKLHLPLRLNLNVHELVTKNLDSGSSSYDLNKMKDIVKYPLRKTWNSITVTEQANIPLQKASFLDRIAQFAVYKTGQQQVIRGEVEVNTEKLFFRTLIKPDGIVNAKLDLVNLNLLYIDSVKSNSKVPQIVGGIKTFLAPIYIDDLRIGPTAYFDAKDINNVNIAHLNRTIVRPTDVIAKEKKFSRLRVEDVEIRGKINGVPFNSLIFVLNDLVQLPRLAFNHLELHVLKTYTFYDYSVLNFLQSRMRKFLGPEQEVTGVITFAALNLLNDTTMSSINQVPIEDIIFSKSDQTQEVIGHKIVVGNISLIGPSVIRNINSYDFSDFIANSVVRNRNHVRDTLEVSSVQLKKGLSVKYFINGHRIDNLLTSNAHIPKLSDLISLVQQVENQIKELDVAEKAKYMKSKRVLYIDYAPYIDISYHGARESNKRCGGKIIESAGHNSVVVREKRDSEMIVDLPSTTITLKPNLNCHEDDVTSKVLSMRWTNKNGLNHTFFRNFSFTNEVADVKFMESRRGDVVMVLTMLNRTNSHSEVAVLWLNNEDNDWHQKQMSFRMNLITKTALVKTFDHEFLVVSSYNDASSTPDSDYVKIFRLNSKENVFVENQQNIVGDKFDIILSVDVSPKGSKITPRTFLLLARKGSKTLFIYRIKEGSQEFSFQRKIPFESGIVEVVVLYINSGPPFFIVSLQTGDFCVFEWRGIESWKVKQCGYFAYINQIKSYEYLKRQHLFLTSTLNSGTALAVHRQGEQLI